MAGTHDPAVWHWSAMHVTAAPPLHTPAWHVSPVVQALLSLHETPFGWTGFEQIPLIGSQVPATWH